MTFVAFFGGKEKVGMPCFAVREVEDISTLPPTGIVPNMNSTYGYFEVIDTLTDAIPKRKIGIKV